MDYTMWPKLIDTNQRTLYTLCHGHLYKLIPHDDSLGDRPLTLYKDDEAIATISVEGHVVDFAVSHEIVVLATLRPARLHICKPYKGTAVLYMRLPLEEPKKNAVSNITLGNFGANTIAIWYGPSYGTVYIGMISGRDAFRFDAVPLVWYDTLGQRHMYLRQEYERILAIPHLPYQFGTVGVISPTGLKFYSLKPYYTMNPLMDESVTMPFLLENGWKEPNAKNYPARLQFSGYDLLVQITGNHMIMKYDPLNSATKTAKDWVRIIVDGVEIGQNDLIYMTPVETDRTLTIKPKANAGDITIHADLPVIFKRQDKTPIEELSQTGIKYLGKGFQKDILMRTTQCITPWHLARFAEKFNLKLRAELWS